MLNDFESHMGNVLGGIKTKKPRLFITIEAWKL